MRAVLFSQTDPGARATVDEFDGSDSVERARALMESVKADFPLGLFAVRGDDEATREDATRRTADMLGISIDDARGYVS